MKNNNEFNSFMIKSFRTDDESVIKGTKKIRYYYTSPSAFLSIIDKRQIRFTDIRYLNDKSEGVYLIKLIINFFEKYKNEYQYSRELFFNLIKLHSIKELEELNVTKIDYNMPMPYMEQRHFVFCMSAKQDSLNMWNYYVNNGNYQGYNIGFSVNKFLKTFDINVDKFIDPFTVYYGDVLYKEAEQYKEIKSFFDLIEKKLSKSHTKQEYDYFLIQIRNYIESNEAFFKNPAFESEKEFRIVIEIADERVHRPKNNYAGENNKQIEDEFTVKNGLIVPFLLVKFDCNAITNVTISPITEFGIAKESVKELLENKIGSNIEVKKSDIPIRF